MSSLTDLSVEASVPNVFRCSAICSTPTGEPFPITVFMRHLMDLQHAFAHELCFALVACVPLNTNSMLTSEV